MNVSIVQTIWLLIFIVSLPSVRSEVNEDPYADVDERSPPAWYTAYMNNDRRQNFLSRHDQETAGRAFLSPVNQTDRNVGSGRVWRGRTRASLNIGSDMPGPSTTQNPQRFVISQNDSPYLAVLREPYGPDDVHRSECTETVCAPNHVCVAPLGFPRCMPKQCFSRPLRGGYMRPSNSPELLKTIKPLEWQFSRSETLELKARGSQSENQPSTEATGTMTIEPGSITPTAANSSQSSVSPRARRRSARG